MDPLLARLDAALRKQRPEYYETLLPGLDAAGLRRLEDAWRAPIPKELRALLSWKCGHAPYVFEHGTVETGEPIWGKYAFMNLDAMIDSIELMREMHEGDEWNDPNWWNLKYIPFAHDTGGDYLLVDMSPGRFSGRGRVMDWAHNMPLRIIVCPSLNQWLEVIVTGLEQGLHAPEQDWKSYNALMQKAHPTYPIQIILR